MKIAIISVWTTQLEGKTIACVTVGGEDRLCLTQLLQLVLSHVDLDKIQKVRISPIF